VVADLALANCAVHRARAEELHGAAAYDVVTARAVAPLARLLGLSMPLVAPAGALVAMKGAAVAEEVQSAARELEALGCSVPEVVTVGAALIDPPTTVVRVVRDGPARVG
jgi:16S rRNA (guanine527-N7)-methyltransferase